MHIDDLVAKVLCRGHNSDLSELDAALVDLVNAQREAARIQTVRAAITKGYWAPHRLVVDGPRIERGILKTMICCATVFREALGDWRPPDWLAAVVFGQRDLPQGCGLCIPAKVGELLDRREAFGVHFGQGSHDRAGPNAFLMTMLGLNLLVTWQVPVNDLGTFEINGEVYSSPGDLLFHPQRCQHAHGRRDLGISFDFSWARNTARRNSRHVENIRRKYRAPPRRK